MTDHTRYEELTALAAGGFLSDAELIELREHLAVCVVCRTDAEELRGLVHWGVPATQGFSNSMKHIKDAPDPGAQSRFLVRARSEGILLSRTETPEPSRFRFSFWPVLAGALATAVLMAVLFPSISKRFSPASQSKGEVDGLKHENDNLSAQLAARDQELANLQKQVGDLTAQLGTAVKTADNYRRESQQKGIRLGRSSSQTAQLLEQLENQDQQLQASTSEIARINQLRATDQASLQAQRQRIREISDQLRIADATLDAERQLSAAGQDIRELLVSRQLHVVDVRDTDENGKPTRAFGRVFLTEGKSLMFFAFDLNDPKVIDAKARFQVWGERIGQKGSLRVLGVLSPDDKTQNRWALKVDNPSLLRNVNSVFVTISAPTGDHRGEKLLNAYLDQPNHT